MTWYAAPSLLRCFAEINARWPDRDKRSDGIIGDTAHAARKSEHNPDSKGCVHAIDIDVNGIDAPVVVTALVAHPATWYVIYDHKIYQRKYNFVPRTYTGSDPHTGHIHLSIQLTEAAENSTARWALWPIARPTPAPARLDQEEPMTRPVILAPNDDKETGVWVWTPEKGIQAINPTLNRLYQLAGAVINTTISRSEINALLNAQEKN